MQSAAEALGRNGSLEAKDAGYPNADHHAFFTGNMKGMPLWHRACQKLHK